MSGVFISFWESANSLFVLNKHLKHNLSDNLKRYRKCLISRRDSNGEIGIEKILIQTKWTYWSSDIIWFIFQLVDSLSFNYAPFLCSLVALLLFRWPRVARSTGRVTREMSMGEEWNSSYIFILWRTGSV